MSDMEIERMKCPHCDGPLDVRHDTSDWVTIAKPNINDIEAAGYKVLTRAEYEALKSVADAARAVYKVHHEPRAVWSREENELHTALTRLDVMNT